MSAPEQGVPGIVYLIHFEEPYEHARHYMGWANGEGLANRMAEHRSGRGANLMRVIAEAGIAWRLVRIWKGGSRLDEKRMKNVGKARMCPVCNPATWHRHQVGKFETHATQRPEGIVPGRDV